MEIKKIEFSYANERIANGTEETIYAKIKLDNGRKETIDCNQQPDWLLAQPGDLVLDLGFMFHLAEFGTSEKPEEIPDGMTVTRCVTSRCKKRIKGEDGKYHQKTIKIMHLLLDDEYTAHIDLNDPKFKNFKGTGVGTVITK